MFCKVMFTLRAPRWDLCPSMILPGYQSERTSRQSSYMLPVPKNEMQTFGIRALRTLIKWTCFPPISKARIDKNKNCYFWL